MSMNWKGALAAVAVLSAGVLAACSDSATAPAPRAAFVPKASLAVGDITNSTPVVGTLKICKAGDTGGTFVITDVGDGIGGTGTPKSLLSPLAVTNGQCRIAVENLGNSTANQGDFYSVVENAPAVPGTTQQLTSCVGLEGAIACNNNYFVNNVHGVVLTFTNTLPPPPPSCTYTKGWYQNKNGAPTIVLTIDGRTPDQQRAIFEASPGQPGNVTWGTNNKPNNLLNLYQQLLAAINNLDGNLTAGPTAVDNAISAALAGTGGSNLHISTTLTNEQISALIDTLSSFNEGEFAGFPHCDDEILVVE